MKECIFSYGTLQLEKTQMALYGRVLKGSNDRLKGYKIRRIEITDPLFLSKGEERYQNSLVQTNNMDDAVDGTVLELTKEELLRTDAYEPANYSRVQILLQSGKYAWVYTTR